MSSLRCFIVLLLILSLGYWRAFTKGTAYTKGAYPQPRETKETSFSQDHMIFGHDKDGKLQIQILPYIANEFTWLDHANGIYNNNVLAQWILGINQIQT